VCPNSYAGRDGNRRDGLLKESRGSKIRPTFLGRSSRCVFSLSAHFREVRYRIPQIQPAIAPQLAFNCSFTTSEPIRLRAKRGRSSSAGCSNRTTQTSATTPRLASTEIWSSRG